MRTLELIRARGTISFALAALLTGCVTSPGASDAGSQEPQDSGPNEMNHDAGVDAGQDGGVDAGQDGGADAGDAGPTCYTLKVVNYDDWCHVSIDDGSFEGGSPLTKCVVPGDIPLAAEPENSTFVLGDWYLTNGDTGSGTPGAVDGGDTGISYSSVTITNADKCVWVCCPGKPGVNLPCPSASQNQCP